MDNTGPIELATGPDATQDASALHDSQESPDTSNLEDQEPSAVKPSAGSEVVQNQDLILHVLRVLKLSLDSTNRTWKRHFVPLLLVNKGLFHTTIEFIWETMDSFKPMFSLLPSFKVDGAGFCTFSGIKETDWNRFTIYAKHVKKIVFEQDPLLKYISERWLVFLVGKSSRVPFFPNLTEITVLHGSDARFLPLAINPRLHSLDIALQASYKSSLQPPAQWAADSSITEASAIIATILALSPTLKELSYLGPISKEFVGSVAALRELTHLRLTPTHVHDFSDLLPIKKMPALQDLKLIILCRGCTPHKRSEFIDEDDAGDDMSGPKMTSLEVVSSTWNVMGIQHYLAPTQLDVFRCQFNAFNAAYGSLALLLDRVPNLTRFIVTAAGINNPETGKHESWNRLRQQELLDNLLYGIETGAMVEVSATEIFLFTEDMAEEATLKCLKPHPDSKLSTFRFHLPFKVPTGVPSQWTATPQTLQYVAFEGCPTLEHLELQFSNTAFTADHIALSSLKLPSKHGLKTLGIVTQASALGLSLQDKISIAMFLNALFPSIEDVWGTAAIEWGEINSLVQSYQIIRRSALFGHNQ